MANIPGANGEERRENMLRLIIPLPSTISIRLRSRKRKRPQPKHHDATTGVARVKVSGSILRVAEFTLLLIETIRRRAEKAVFHGIKVSFLSFVAGIGREVNVSLTSENGAKGMSDIERSELATASLRPDWR